MLSDENNELITRVGPGTPMGAYLRQYWMPLALSSELPGRDSRPLRIRLLGENLIAFRDSDGEVGLLGDHCPHRGASLYFGRNEVSGLRCVYHGRKFDVAGRCVDMPNEPPESNFKDKVRAVAYPCRERNGIVWTYMGPRESPPGLPELELATVPESHRWIRPSLRECNWLQALEGDIDSAHSSFLHSVLRSEDLGTHHTDRYTGDKPRFDVVDTEYGVMIGVRRAPVVPAPDGSDPSGWSHWRISQFVAPIFTMFPPTGPGTETIPGHIWIPIDDDNTLVWSYAWHPSRPIRDGEPFRRNSSARPDGRVFEPAEEYLPATTAPAGAWHLRANKSNDFMLDYGAQKTVRFSGVPTITLQDSAMTSSMGAVANRTVEHLGSTDTGIIRMRRWLLEQVLALRDEGIAPAGVDDPTVFRVRSASGLLPKDDSWLEGSKDWILARTDRPVSSI
jgi:phthalate 4,5-dioxygenase